MPRAPLDAANPMFASHYPTRLAAFQLACQPFQRVESGGGGGEAVEPGPSERCTITLSAQRP